MPGTEARARRSHGEEETTGGPPVVDHGSAGVGDIQALMASGGNLGMVQLSESDDSRTTTPSTTRSGTLTATTSAVTVTPATTGLDLSGYTGSKGKYEENYAVSKADIPNHFTPPDAARDTIAAVESKKDSWFQAWGTAVLQTDADAARAQLAAVREDLAATYPDDSPGDGGGHLYTGRTGAGRGRERAEVAATEANAEQEAEHPTEPAARVNHRTLETTFLGRLFDGVADSWRPTPEDQATWIPYNGSQAGEWWSHVSAEYANTFVGEVHGHIDIGMPYFVSKVGQGLPYAQRVAMDAELSEVLRLPRDSVFAKDELKNIAKLMELNQVTSLKAHLRIEVTPGTFKTASPSIPGGSVSSYDELLAAVDAQIAALVSLAELKENIVDPAATPGP